MRLNSYTNGVQMNKIDAYLIFYYATNSFYEHSCPVPRYRFADL